MPVGLFLISQEVGTFTLPLYLSFKDSCITIAMYKYTTYPKKTTPKGFISLMSKHRSGDTDTRVNHRLHHAILEAFVANTNDNAPLDTDQFLHHYQELHTELKTIQAQIPADALEARRYLESRLDHHKQRVAQDHYQAIMEDRVADSRPKDDRLYRFVDDSLRLIDEVV